MRFSLLFAIGVVISGVSNSVYSQDIFPDIAEHAYRESIMYLQVREVVKGYPDGTFGPDRGVTRAEMLKIIFESLRDEVAVGSGSNCFVDVFDQRYAPYVCYAKDEEIVRGYPGNVFKPEQGVTIAEGLKIALETFEQPVDETDDDRWYEPYVQFVHDNNIFSTYALRPEQPMTRAQMSYLVHQLLLEKKGERIFDSQRDSRSPGCFQPPPRGAAPSSSMVGGIHRNYITVVGDKINHQYPSPLIFAFHGRTSPNTEVRQYYKLEKIRDEQAIIIYPSGLPEQGPSRNRGVPTGPERYVRDYALFDTLVTEFAEQYCIDMDEIYAIGHSLGAWFTNSLGCARGDVLRGIGSVGGSTTIGECSGPVAAMIMHNPNDRLASFGGGITARDQLLLQNACGPETREVGPAEGNCVEYTNCTSGAPVIWCPHTQNHARWDGSYYPHTRPDFATREIWDFRLTLKE